MAIAGLHATGCGSSSPTAPAPAPVVLLDTMVTLAQGTNCNVAYAGAEFSGTAGTTVAIAASGPSTLTPLFILYAPDFATQLASSSSHGAGAAALTFTVTQSGVHHLAICDVNGAAGTLRITVQQQK